VGREFETCLKLILSDCLVGQERAKIVVVGSGPAGLFAALVLAESGAKVTLVERGQPVEGRGKDIGALMVRRVLNAESNLCYGEVGAYEHS
jgi:ribulose 1,5-bisphosphate synthetase/thiazole synthase